MFFLKELKEDGLVVLSTFQAQKMKQTLLPRVLMLRYSINMLPSYVVKTTFMSRSRMIANLEAREGFKSFF